MATVTKPMALDETLQGTNNTISTQNSKLDTMNTKLQAIVDAIGSSSLIGDTDISGIADGTITGAIAGLDSGKVDKTSLGANNGVAQLDSTGKVPSSQLPSFVDDVLEYASASAFPATGESGKIYVALDTNLTYRWGGSAYVEISPSLALGETSSTAYRGDRGKIAYDHSQDANRVTIATAVGLYKVGATSEGHISGLTPIQKSDLTGLGLVGSVTDSTTNGNIVVDGVEIQAYDDTDVQNDIDAIEDELSTDYATVEGNPINFSTKSAQNAKSTILSVEPIQDLHGYDKPWVGGAGKNLLPLTVSNIKALNTAGTWNDLVYTYLTTTFTLLVDSDNNVLGIKINGTPTNNINFFLWNPISLTSGSSYYLNGCPDGGSTSTYMLRFYNSTTTGSKNVINSNDALISDWADQYNRCEIRITANVQYNNIIFKPMVRLASIADSNFEPYENICPISGRSEIGILGEGANIWDRQWEVGVFNQTTGLPESGTSNAYRTKNKIAIEPNKSYIYKSNVAGRFFFYSGIEDVASNYISNTIVNQDTAFTTPQNAHYMNFQASDTIDVSNVTINRQSNNLTISLGQTVYGGTLDVENGVLVVDSRYKEFTSIGSETWYKRPNRNIFYTAWTDTAARAPSLTGTEGCFNSNYKCVTKEIDLLDNGECINSSSAISSSNLSVGARDERYTTVEDFKASLSTPMQIVYPLTTPITINLTPNTINLLKGVNNINTDGDKITLTYRDGSVATLGDLTSAVDSLDGKIEDSKILTDTVTGDKYILVVSNGVLDIQQISN